MKNSSRFFKNIDCTHFPCHADAEPDAFNCLFCYCPLYFLPECPGSPRRTETGVKNCTGCLFPHRPENYECVIRCLSTAIRERAQAYRDASGTRQTPE